MPGWNVRRRRLFFGYFLCVVTKKVAGLLLT